MLLLALVSVFAFTSCGDDEEVGSGLQEAVVGTWVQTQVIFDCPQDEEDETFDFTCDEMNCRQIILGQDSTFTSINISSGVTVRIDEFYLFTSDILTMAIEDNIEICDGVAFNRECSREFGVSVSGNTLRLSRTDDDDCLNTVVYRRVE